jgi:hypothetical protein
MRRFRIQQRGPFRGKRPRRHPPRHAFKRSGQGRGKARHWLVSLTSRLRLAMGGLRHAGRTEAEYRAAPKGWVEAWHGTPSQTNAQNIQRYGFQVGSGNAAGDGVYTSRKFEDAKVYAAPSGVVVRCWVRTSRCCDWTPAMAQRFHSWCRERFITPDNSAKTAFLLKHHWKVLRQGSVLVVLAPQMVNPGAWKRRFSEIRVKGFHSPLDGKAIRI